MIFTLEALPARHGDCLLLHYDAGGAPGLILIDGGPSGVYSKTLKPRLAELRSRRAASPDGTFSIRLLMVSHLDDDHIAGIVDLTMDLDNRRSDRQPLPYRIQTIWHNTFDDIVGNGAKTLFDAAVASVGPAALQGEIPPQLLRAHPGALILANVPQGRTVRDKSHSLGFEINKPGTAGLVGTGGASGTTVLRDGALTLRMLGPNRQRITQLQQEWDTKLRELGLATTPAALAEAAAYVDKSVYNLSSLIVLADAGGKRMLLTGDARGDEILEGLHQQGLLSGGRIHVDVLKVPHHGSDRNVADEFFQSVTADHYVISADGKYGNPELATFKMITNARGKDAYTVHLTYDVSKLEYKYPKSELQDYIKAHSKQRGFTFSSVGPTGSVVVDLLDPLAD